MNFLGTNSVTHFKNNTIGLDSRIQGAIWLSAIIEITTTFKTIYLNSLEATLITHFKNNRIGFDSRLLEGDFANYRKPYGIKDIFNFPQYLEPFC